MLNLFNCKFCIFLVFRKMKSKYTTQKISLEPCLDWQRRESTAKVIYLIECRVPSQFSNNPQEEKKTRKNKKKNKNSHIAGEFQVLLLHFFIVPIFLFFTVRVPYSSLLFQCHISVAPSLLSLSWSISCIRCLSLLP